MKAASGGKNGMTKLVLGSVRRISWSDAWPSGGSSWLNHTGDSAIDPSGRRWW